jgi:hypothetical protein
MATHTKTLVERKFEEAGARVRLRHIPARHAERGFVEGRFQRRLVPNGFAIDVAVDRRGEYFDLRVPPGIDLDVLDVDRADRHLLLMTRTGEEKARYLCGHDERHWFVAAIPEITPVTTVERAKHVLAPEVVREASRRLRPKERAQRKTRAYVRQGE